LDILSKPPLGFFLLFLFFTEKKLGYIPSLTNMLPRRLVLADLSVSSGGHDCGDGDEGDKKLNEEGMACGRVVQIGLQALYTMMGEVYRSCDFFCQLFGERYPSPAALRDEIREFKQWRRQVEYARQHQQQQHSSEQLLSRCAAPMYLIAMLEPEQGAEPCGTSMAQQCGSLTKIW